MAMSVDFECNNCGYSFSTSGPWEFRRDKNGKIKLCGHPMTAENERKGIEGLIAYLYCKQCDQVVEAILEEYKNTKFNVLDVWEQKQENSNDNAGNVFESAVCPKCHKQELFICFEEENSSIKCPRCEEGHIKEVGGAVC